MKLPGTTSKLLALREATSRELGLRMAEIFKRYRGLAFVARSDNLFTERWTPELAASGYEFAGFDVKNNEVILHGVEEGCGFIYRISISFPLDLIDNAFEIDAYFQRRYADAARTSLGKQLMPS